MSIDTSKFGTYVPAEYKSVIDLVVRVAEFQGERKDQTCIQRRDLTDRETVTILHYVEETYGHFYGAKIQHIKDLKDTFGLGLAAAKYFVDMFHGASRMAYAS